jgi:hypothetical protein
MQLVYDKKRGLVLGFKPEELHIVFGVLSYLVKNWVAVDATAFYAVYHKVEADLREKLLREETAKRYKLCCKCFKEIDTEKDKYHHTQFESGYEVWSHQECPPTNVGKGYEQ